MTEKNFTLSTLAEAIHRIDGELSTQASRAVNVSLTLRNWLIGCYIAEYELNGEDRAVYGEKVLSELAKHLNGVSNCNRRQLYDYLRFYRAYPQIVRTVSAQLQRFLPVSPPAAAEKVPTVSALSGLAPDEAVSKLSYSMFRLLVDLEDGDKRAFYEIESTRGNWSVRELKRQIGSLYYERTFLSLNKKKLSESTERSVERISSRMTVRDPYVFEFLGLKPREVMGESNLEERLVEKLEEFLLEMGHGFCFEARQKRILIGGEHFFVDLVFYHRVLKCHVLVELKVKQFTHENLGQLNTYVNWYRQNMMTDGDNPPVGILLCTEKNHALVEYALAGMDNQLFVSKYQLQLPGKEEMEKFIEAYVSETAPE